MRLRICTSTRLDATTSRLRLVPVHSEHEGDLARLRCIARIECQHARFDEQLAASPRQRETAAGVPAILMLPAAIARSESEGAIRTIDAHRQILEHRVRVATDAVDAEAVCGAERVGQEWQLELEV